MHRDGEAPKPNDEKHVESDCSRWWINSRSWRRLSECRTSRSARRRNENPVSSVKSIRADRLAAVLWITNR